MNQPAPQDTPSPDAWRHMQETVKLLQLAVAQIEASILDSENSFNRLATNFTGIIETAQAAPDLTQRIEELRSRLIAIQSDVQTAVMDFQFFDRLAQRLSHVKESLEELGDILSNGERVNEENIWDELQQGLKNRYTMQCEREMFDMMLAGATVEEALNHFKANFLKEREAQAEDGDIDLF